MRNVMLMAFVALALFSACKKDEPNVDPETVYPDYGCLKAGNYWIYEHFTVDTLGGSTSLNKFDSCYVEKDTLINGETYAKMFRPYPYHQSPDMPNRSWFYLRDSLHYIVDYTGAIKFSSEDFLTVFQTHFITSPNGDTIYTASAKMDDINQRIAVPAGEYSTMNYKTIYKLNPEFTQYTEKVSNMKYAKDVGVVVETLPMFASVPTKNERWLVRYHVK